MPEQRGPDTLGPRGGRRRGKLIEKAVDYVADFVYLDEQGKTVVEDANGSRILFRYCAREKDAQRCPGA